MNLEKTYTDLSPEQRKAQTVPQPTGFTRLQTFYDKQDKDMTAQFVFGTMVEIATPILEAYHSDLYHDAIELKGRDWRKEQIFLYCVGKCGTNIVEKLTEAETLKKHGRENVFAFNYTRHPSLKKCFQLEVVKV